MTTEPIPSLKPAPWWRVALPPVIAISIVIGGLWRLMPQIIEGYRHANYAPHWPRWGLIAQLPLQMQTHIASALAAVLIGFVVLARPKGRGLHKVLGWAWVLAMLATAVTSLFITGLNGNSYSIIHLLSGWVLVILPLGIFFIRNRNVGAHRRAMVGTFFGGLLVAGLLTFIPGRFMFEFFFR